MNIRDEQGRIRGLPENWQQYILCLLFHLLWPMIPLGVEELAVGSMSSNSLSLTAFMYAVGLGIAGRNMLVSFFSLGLGAICALFFGMAQHASSADRNIKAFSIIIMIALFLLHALERFNRHVADKAPFLEIGRKET